MRLDDQRSVDTVGPRYRMLHIGGGQLDLLAGIAGGEAVAPRMH